MAGKLGQKWGNRKKDKADALTWKENVALKQATGEKVKARADENEISRSAVIRQCVEKEFNRSTLKKIKK